MKFHRLTEPIQKWQRSLAAVLGILLAIAMSHAALAQTFSAKPAARHLQDHRHRQLLQGICSDRYGPACQHSRHH
jgi:hypothetical protein